MSSSVPGNCRGNACRCVLGDRAYSKPWGGSVLDSVIGTFLTQNVSDQLSSKAYMTLATRFPARTPILNPSLHPKHMALPPELPVHGNADGNCMASSPNADQTTAAPMDKGLANCDDLGMRERQLVVTDGVDISDAVNWEAVRRAPASQVILLHSSLPHKLLAQSISQTVQRQFCFAACLSSLGTAGFLVLISTLTLCASVFQVAFQHAMHNAC